MSNPQRHRPIAVARRAAEVAPNASSKLFATIPTPCVLFDAALRPIRVNDAYRLLMGDTGGAGDLPDYRDVVAPDARQQHARLLGDLVAGRSASFRMELPLVWPTGADRIVLADGAPHGAGAVVALTDVTALRRHREVASRRHDALDQALHEMMAGLALFDADDRLVFCNRRYRELYDVPDELARPGTRFADMLLEEVRRGRLDLPAEAARDFVAARLDRRHAADGRPTEQRNGEGRWLQIRERVMPGGWLVGIHIDVSELKQKEVSLEATVDALRETRGQLERRTVELSELATRLAAARDEALGAARAKANFLANMSHELRTPLNAVIGFAELLASGAAGPLSDQQREYLEDIRKSGSHLLSVINDILDLSKADAEKIALDEEIFDLGKFLHATGRMMAAAAQAKGIDYAAVPDAAAADLAVRADRRRLRQVLLNLLSNAIKFTPPGGQVRLGATRLADGGVALAVADTGIGIAAADMAKVFAPFEQGDGSLARKYEGTGLGMALVKALVDLHQGVVAIDSQPGEGTQVFVRLPPSRVVRIG